MSKTGGTFVLYYATPWGYHVAVYDKTIQPIEEHRGGNHPGDSSEVITPQDGYEPGEVRPVSVEQLTAWARKTALEMAAEYGLPLEKVSYDSDGEADEIEERKILSADC